MLDQVHYTDVRRRSRDLKNASPRVRARGEGRTIKIIDGRPRRSV